MNRRDFVKRICLGAAGSTAMMTFPGLFAGSKAKGGKYNVLFIWVDDLRTQLGCYGQTQMISPNIDRLASQGLLFEHAYCQEALCAPSRSSLLSGLRPDSTGIYKLGPRLSEVLPDRVSLPKYFKQNGYETISIGKVYHNRDDDMGAWSRIPFPFDKEDKTHRQFIGREKYQSWRESHNRSQSGPPAEIVNGPDNACIDGILTDYAIEELNRIKDKPFFLCTGFMKPHLPFRAPKKYWDMYDPKKLKLADNPFYPKGVTKYSLFHAGELRKYDGVPKGWEPIPDELARHLRHGYYSCVSFIDAQVGRLLDELKRLNLRDRTVIVLLGDHGWKLGEHRDWSKCTNFELDAQAPLLISVPGMKTAGRKTKALTEFVDIYPTLCDVCGLGLPKQPFEGRSFAPLLADPDRDWKGAAFSQFPRYNHVDGKMMVMGHTMRTRRYRYTEWKDVKTGKLLARELYDHMEDPQENINVIDDPKYSAAIKKLRQMMKVGWKGVVPGN